MKPKFKQMITLPNDKRRWEMEGTPDCVHVSYTEGDKGLLVISHHPAGEKEGCYEGYSTAFYVKEPSLVLRQNMWGRRSLDDNSLLGWTTIVNR